jgi:hypothetical protein
MAQTILVDFTGNAAWELGTGDSLSFTAPFGETIVLTWTIRNDGPGVINVPSFLVPSPTGSGTAPLQLSPGSKSPPISDNKVTISLFVGVGTAGASGNIGFSFPPT